MTQPTSGFDLGTAYGKVVISTNVAEVMQKAQADMKNGIQNLGSSMQSLGSAMQSTGGAITTLTAPLALFGATGLKTAMDFDSAMTMIGARTGLTGEALDKIKDKALDLGAKTAFSSQQAADAFLNLLTAGLSVEDSMSAIDHVMTAAAASGESLGITADNLTGVMAAFGLNASEAGRIVESMSRAGSASKASMTDMGYALQDVGGIAKSYGISLEDTSAILAIFAGQNIKGTEAGTQLRSMLLAMDAPTKRAQETWAELGISMYDAQGNSRRMADVMRDLQVVLKDKSDEEKNRIVKALAGSYGLVGFTALAAGEGIDAMRAKMDAQQSAADVAARNTDTFAFALESLGGSIETLQQTSLIPFMNQTLKPLVNQMVEAINGVTDWVKANPELTQTIVKVGAALVMVGPLLVGAGIVLSSLGTVVVALGGAMSALLSPIGLLAAAFVADFGGIRTAVTPVLENLFNGFNQIRNAISWIWSDIQHFGLTNLIDQLISGENSGRYEFMIQNILFALGMGQEEAANMAQTIYEVIQNFLGGVESIVNTVRPLFEQVVIFIQNVINNIDWNRLLEIGIGLFNMLNPIELVRSAFALFGIDIGQVLRDVITAATTFFTVLNDGGTVWDGIRAVFGDSQFLRDIEAGFNGIVKFVQDFIAQHGDVVVAFAKLIGIGLLLSPVISGISTVVGALAAGFAALFSPAILLAGAIAAIVLAAEAGYPGGIAQLLRDAATAAQQLAIMGLGILSLAATNARIVIEGFRDVIITFIPKLVEWIDKNAGIILGLIALGIAISSSGTITTAYNVIVTALSVKMTAAGTAATALSAKMMLAVGPVIAVGIAIAGVIAQLQEFMRTMDAAAKYGQEQLADEVTQGNINYQDVQKASFGAISAEFGGGFFGDLLARVFDENVAQSFTNDVIAPIAKGNAQSRDSGGQGKKGMSYRIGTGAQPEMFIPETNGTFVPNADKLGGDTYQIELNISGANSYKEGREAANGGLDAINERMRSKGLKLRS